MLWDPVSGYDGATVINYRATVAHIRREKLKEERALREEHEDKRINDQQLAQGLKDISEKYAINEK